MYFLQSSYVDNNTVSACSPSDLAIKREDDFRLWKKEEEMSLHLKTSEGKTLEMEITGKLVASYD